jgi:hypothetical protein
MKLGRIAHSRTGDKGNTSNISVIAYDVKFHSHLCEHLTAQRVSADFANIVKGAVARYELPSISALNFVLTDALEGGVTRTLALDAHGKRLSSVCSVSSCRNLSTITRKSQIVLTGRFRRSRIAHRWRRARISPPVSVTEIASHHHGRPSVCTESSRTVSRPLRLAAG